ncbi:Hypothetical protein FKW44_002194 [Caligus rogercresseyi]|uniref:Uncharacterized protein n=1 Tax=Caligus rogercresseyi TaxID=217165 RepID=A0A7T8KJU8_CALRO|nr:Hypothetical protein FKW44_002194 [Caligus rogercresseyi]
MNDAVNTFRLAEVAEAEMEAKIVREQDPMHRIRNLSRGERVKAQTVEKIIDGGKISPKVMKYYVSSIIVSKQSSGKEKAIFQGLRNCFHVS